MDERGKHPDFGEMVEAEPSSLQEFKKWLAVLIHWWRKYMLHGEKIWGRGAGGRLCRHSLCRAVSNVLVHADRSGISLDHLPKCPRMDGYDAELVLRFLNRCMSACDQIEHLYREMELRQGPLVARLLAGPDEVILSPDDLGLLEFTLRDCLASAEHRQASESSPRKANLAKLIRVREFNRGLHLTERGGSPAPGKPTARPGESPTGDSTSPPDPPNGSKDVDSRNTVAREEPTHQAAPKEESASASSFAVDALERLADEARMTHLDLAEKLGLDAERLRSRLDRWRNKNLGSDGWNQVGDRKARQPTYLYRVGNIRGVLKKAIRDAGRKK
jgi:hypothetical protein